MRHHAILIFLAGLTFTVNASSWTVPTLRTESYGLWVLGSIAHDPETGKLYAGLRARDNRALVVFDTTPDGVITGVCRRFLVYPEPIPAGNEAIVQRILIDKAHSQLFLGLSFSVTRLPGPIITLPLDETGEPAGPPARHEMGSPQNSCQDLALHPFVNRLYAVGWGGTGVYALNLDPAGSPTGSPVVFPVGSYGKYSLQFKPDGSKLYLGTYPSALEVCDLTPAGNVTNAMRRYLVPDGPAVYLQARAAAGGVFFQTARGRLSWFPLSAQGEPDGTVLTDTNRFIQGLQLSPGGTLALAESLTFPDAFSGQVRTNGFQVRDYTTSAAGISEPSLRESLPFNRLKATLLATQPGPVAAVSSLPGFLGNAWSGLQMRLSLPAVTPLTTLTVVPKKISFGSQARYLTFAYSPRFNQVYAAGSNTLFAYSPEGTGSLSTAGTVSNAGPVAVDDELRLLYAARNNGVLEWRTLDPAGAITGEAACVASGMSSIRVLAVNPASHHVYMLGSGGTAGELACPLLPEPARLVRAPVSAYVQAAQVDPVRGRLYATDGYAAGHSNLLVWTLAPDGALAQSTPRRYADAIPMGTNTVRSTLSGLVLDAERNQLLAGGRPESGGGIGGWIVTHALDEGGDPLPNPGIVLSSNVSYNTWSLALARQGSLLAEAGQGDPRFFTRPRDPSGLLSSNVTAWKMGSYGKSQLAYTTNETALLAGTYPSILEVVPLLTNGLPVPGATAALTVGAWTTNIGYLCAGGDGSDWIPLDAVLTNKSGLVEATLAWSGGSISDATVQIEFSLWQDGLRLPLTPVTARIQGNTITLLLPGYGFDPDRTNQTGRVIEEADALFSRYASNAAAVAVAPADRPRRFIISNGLIGLDSGFQSLDKGIRAAADLGHNTLQIWNYSARIPPDTVRALCASNGITGFRLAVYNPPSYFDYNTGMVDAVYLDEWAAGFRASLASMGAGPDELRLFKMADEPGWYFPSQINTVTSSPSRLAVFRQSLADKGCVPADFGQSDWSAVFPMPLSGATNLPARRLLYRTARFYTESLSRSFAAGTAALRRQFNDRLLVTANLNNWPGRFFIPSPGKAIANNPDVGPDSAMGMPDWFDLVRQQGVSCLWTEDWFSDREAQRWSFYADLLRGASRSRGSEYGAYVVGQSTGGMADGGAYKILALAGHGAKVVDLYVFASWYAFDNCWSERPAAYRSVADGLRLLGRAENLLFEGRPRTGSVALLLPQASQVWDTNSTMKLYLNELYGLHAGLVHSRYPVDIVDDTDLENGLLTSNRYEVLYLTAPSLSTNAQAAVLRWVEAGGTLALFPGAGAGDEYNEPTTLLTDAMGASWAAAPRATPPSHAFVTQTWVTVLDPRLGVTADVSRAQTVPLTAGQAAVRARFGDGSVALTEHGRGAGRIWAYGYWPGSTYMLGRDDFDLTRLPRDWPASTRLMVTAPARLAEATRFIGLDRDCVEAAVLESRHGLAVTLLNWSGDPISSLAVTVPLSEELGRAHRERVLRVESARLGRLAYRIENGALCLDAPLNTVDVLSLRTPRGGLLMLVR